MNNDSQMKVYAEFIQENNISYRKNTLLQFGNSTDLIGSAVLMNPGSASPNNNKFDINIIKIFYKKTHNADLESQNLWHCFTSDPTIKQLEKIFNGWYIKDKPIELNGIIQLFNCFYFKDQNLTNAAKQFLQEPKYLFNESSLFSNKPVYFGWGDEGKNGVFRDIAKKIFSEYNHEYTPIYNTVFEENCFYYPKTINMLYKKDENVKKFLKDFHGLISNKYKAKNGI